MYYQDVLTVVGEVVSTFPDHDGQTVTTVSPALPPGTEAHVVGAERVLAGGTREYLVRVRLPFTAALPATYWLVLADVPIETLTAFNLQPRQVPVYDYTTEPPTDTGATELHTPTVPEFAGGQPFTDIAAYRAQRKSELEAKVNEKLEAEYPTRALLELTLKGNSPARTQALNRINLMRTRLATAQLAIENAPSLSAAHRVLLDLS